MASVAVAVALLIITVFVSPSFKGYTLKKTVVLALLLAISVGGRLIFSGIPSMQLSSYVIIITGIIFGMGAGFFLGVGTALLSNLILGFGPYLVWQMLGWGLMGLFSPYLKKWNRISVALYGFFWGYIYGFITNLQYMLDGFVPICMQTVIAAQIASFNFDSIHAITNLLLLLVLPHTAVKKLMQKSIGNV